MTTRTKLIFLALAWLLAGICAFCAVVEWQNPTEIREAKPFYRGTWEQEQEPLSRAVRHRYISTKGIDQSRPESPSRRLGFY